MRNDTIREFLRIVLRRKGIFLLTVCMVSAATFLGLQLKTPVYEAKVTMLIQARKQVTSPYYEDIRGGDALALTATQSEIVTSNPVIERTVRRLRLTELPKDYEKQFASPLKVYFIDVKNKAASLLSGSSVKADSEVIRFRKAVEELKERTKVTPVRDTNLFTITVTDYSPDAAVRIANMISRSYAIFDLEQQLAEMKQKYGDKHLFVKQLKDNIDSIEQERPSDKVSHQEAIGPASVKVIEQATVPIKPQGVSTLLIMAVALIASIGAGGACAFIAEGHDTGFRSAEDVAAALPVPLLGSTPRRFHPGEAALGAVRFLARVFVAVIVGCVVLESLGVWAQVDAGNQVLVLARSCTRWFTGLWMGDSVTEGAARARAALLIGGVVFASAAAGLSSWGMRMIEGRLPLLKNARKRSPEARAYGDISDELMRAASRGKRGGVVVIAHAVSAARSSALVVNLGMSLSQAKGYKVLLIDADLGSPRLDSFFKVKSRSGLAEFLRSNGKSALPVQEVSGGLYLVAAGGRAPDALTLLRLPAMRELLDSSSRDYDCVLLHCAALSGSKDIYDCAPHTAGVVVVLDEQRVRRDMVKAQIEECSKKEIPVLGVVLQNSRI